MLIYTIRRFLAFYRCCAAVAENSFHIPRRIEGALSIQSCIASIVLSVTDMQCNGLHHSAYLACLAVTCCASRRILIADRFRGSVAAAQYAGQNRASADKISALYLLFLQIRRISPARMFPEWIKILPPRVGREVLLEFKVSGRTCYRALGRVIVHPKACWKCMYRRCSAGHSDTAYPSL